MVKRSNSSMMEKITTRDLSTGIKVGYIVASIAISAVVASLSVGYSSGQTMQKIEGMEKEIIELKLKVDDSARVKEQVAIDIAVIKTNMFNMDKSLTELKELLSPKRKREE